MESSEEKKNQQWLSAVAGRPEADADPLMNTQAEAVRHVLSKHKGELEAKIPTLDERVYRTILARVQKEREVKVAVKRPVNWVVALGAWLRFNYGQIVVSGQFFAQPRAWGLAASIVVGVLVVLQSGLLTHTQQNESMVYRGNNTEIVQIVDDPAARLDDLLKEFGAMGIGAQVKVRREPQKITIEVPNTTKVIQYLEEQHFTPDPDLHLIVIVLKPSANKR